MTALAAKARKVQAEGVRRIENKLTAASRVRREFLSGRPKKAPLIDKPLHPSVVWERATDALKDFRARMAAAGLDGVTDARAFVIYVAMPNIMRPEFLALDGIEGEDETPADHRRRAFEKLEPEGTIALGMVFVQNDREAANDTRAGQISYFAYQFMGLSEAGAAVLKAATHLLFAANRLQFRAR